MSLILPIERKSWRVRALYAAMYAIAIVGAITMVYPFLVMVSGSFRSTVDADDFDVIPRFLFDETMLFRKYEQARYNASQPRWQMAVKSSVQSWDGVNYPTGWNEAAARDVESFVASPACEPWMLVAGQTMELGSQPRVQRLWRSFLSKRFGGDIDRLNAAVGTRFQGWDRVPTPEASRIYRDAGPDVVPFSRLFYDEFRPTLAKHEFWPVHLEGAFYYELLQRFGDVKRLNAAKGTKFESLESIPLATTYPAGKPEASLWEMFVRENANLSFLRLKPSAETAYRAFLLGRYKNIDSFNRAHVTKHISFDQVTVPVVVPPTDPGYTDFRRFIQEGDCLPHVEIDSFESRWREFLRNRYKTIDACAVAHGRSYASFETIPLRLDEYDAFLLKTHRGEILREFLTRNYAYVIDFLALRGNALKVTALFVGLSVLFHLIINPLAAYALSRYRLRWGHWILLFCVLTMAFPAEVGSIPRFLLIREFGLLNTIWALVLPGAAHGLSIFMLKSFFDGLPQELYEAALLEGAPERWMFWNVTVALTKPILAVTAFGAFTSAYGSFLFALIIAPEERMWTISVWLYQFQQQVTEPTRFAALVVASLPVLVAFLVMQRFILRGIVLPVER